MKPPPGDEFLFRPSSSSSSSLLLPPLEVEGESSAQLYSQDKEEEKFRWQDSDEPKFRHIESELDSSGLTLCPPAVVIGETYTSGKEEGGGDLIVLPGEI